MNGRGKANFSQKLNNIFLIVRYQKIAIYPDKYKLLKNLCKEFKCQRRNQSITSELLGVR